MRQYPAVTHSQSCAHMEVDQAVDEEAAVRFARVDPPGDENDSRTAPATRAL
jgi:hypothetical protein